MARLRQPTKPAIESMLKEHGTIGMSFYKKYRGAGAILAESYTERQKYWLRKKKEELARAYAIARKMASIESRLDVSDATVAHEYSTLLLIEHLVMLEQLWRHIPLYIRVCADIMLRDSEIADKYENFEWVRRNRYIEKFGMAKLLSFKADAKERRENEVYGGIPY